MIKAANILLDLGAKNVLLKGGHNKSEVIEDVYLNNKELKIFRNKKYLQRTLTEQDAPFPAQSATYLSCGKPLKKSVS